MTNIFYAITSDTGTNICTHFLPSKGILWTFYYLRAFCPRDYQSLSSGHAGVADEAYIAGIGQRTSCAEGDYLTSIAPKNIYVYIVVSQVYVHAYFKQLP